MIGDGFDAVLCLGNSFAHMLDAFGDQREQKQAICNFEKCVKPGGILLIDHRNYDNIMDTGDTPSKSIYYNVSSLFHNFFKFNFGFIFVVYCFACIKSTHCKCWFIFFLKMFSTIKSNGKNVPKK